MNVLDRCSKPLSLLKSVKKYLTTENGLGIVLLALVIPYYPYVESGREQLEPEEYMKIKNTNFEIGVTSFIEKVLIPEGWNIINFARVPYISEGDIYAPYYVFDNVALTMRLISTHCSLS